MLFFKKRFFGDRDITLIIIAVCIMIMITNGFMYWWDVKEIEANTSGIHNVAIDRYKDFLFKNAEADDSLKIKNRILLEIDMQMTWEWNHEKINRSNQQAIEYLIFFITIAIFLTTVSFLRNKEVDEGNLLVSKERLNLLIFFSVLNVFVYGYSGKQNYPFKQKAHDSRARHLLVLRNGLDMNMMNNEKAWENFRTIYLIDPEEYSIMNYDKNRYSK
jgi:hypothetical protein